MMSEELGLIEGKNNPLDNAVNTFVGFNVVGIIPLILFLFLYVSGLNLSIGNAFVYSVIATASSFFLIGSIRGKVVEKPMFRSGFNTLLIGGTAAMVAYAVGHLISIFVH
jgi:vacuolar iron transporter family protein